VFYAVFYLLLKGLSVFVFLNMVSMGVIEVISGVTVMKSEIAEFQARIERFSESLLKWATVQTPVWLRSRLDPADLVQQTLLESISASMRLMSRSDQELLNYLRRALANNLIDAVRKHGKARGEVSPDILADTSRRMCDWLAAPDTSPSERMNRNERYERLAAGLAKLPDAQRIVVEMRYFQGVKLADIAETMGRSEGAVAALLHRAVTTLRGDLVHLNPFE
jgi:RNA polymerase sigma-70 factor, ECF subfamily